jgi:hypothetical protein
MQLTAKAVTSPGAPSSDPDTSNVESLSPAKLPGFFSRQDHQRGFFNTQGSNERRQPR